MQINVRSIDVFYDVTMVALFIHKTQLDFNIAL